MLFYLCMVLKRLGYQTVMARSAEDALHLMEEGAPTGVLTELALPGMSGMELLRRMKGSPAHRAVPVIMHTADADQGVKDSCRDLGCAAFLSKPADPELLFHAVEAASTFMSRHNIRISASLPVVLADNGRATAEQVTAISEGGLYVRTLRVRPKDSVLPVTITIDGQEITASAQVLYRTTLGKGPFKEPGMGMKFVEISGNGRELIREFIRQQLTADIDVKKGKCDKRGDG
jgi:CheY-like chemotaxis protein